MGRDFLQNGTRMGLSLGQAWDKTSALPKTTVLPSVLSFASFMGEQSSLDLGLTKMKIMRLGK